MPARLLASIVTLLLLAAPASAQLPDSASKADEPLFVRRDAVILGGVMLGMVALAPLDVRLAHEVRAAGPQGSEALHDLSTGFRLLGNPGAVIIGTGAYAIGRVAGLDRLADIGLHTSEAFWMGQAFTTAGKWLVGRRRPLADVDHSLNFGLGRGVRSDTFQSFPSGHTSSAFATAAAISTEITRVHPEYRWLVRVPLYGAAGLVGISRMYDNKHWASDVLLGATIGTFSAWKVVGYNHSHPGNRVDRFFLRAKVVPTRDGRAALVWTYPTGGS